MANEEVLINPNYRVYKEDIGEKGTIYMVDTGSYCTFYLQVDDPNFTKKLNFRYGFPTSIAKKDASFTYPAGGSLYPIRSNSVFTSGDCFFTLRKTGTPELGTGGTLRVAVSRGAKVPPPPEVHIPSMVNDTTVKVSWDNRGAHDAGGYITQIDIAHSRTEDGKKTILNGVKTGTGTTLQYSGSHNVSGLSKASLYYFFVRCRTKTVKDSKGKITGGGAGPWSEPVGILTSGGVMVRHNNEWRNSVPYVKKGGVWKEARAYHKKSGSWKQTR